MRVRRLLGTALVVVLGVALAIPPAALAADATASPSLLPPSAVAKAASGTPLSLIDVQVWPSASTSVKSTLIVVGTVPTSTPLPTTVYLPLPANAPVQWIGEIQGTDQSNDIQRPVIVEDGVGGKVLKVKVEKHREVQYEAELPAPKDAKGRRTLSFAWVQSAPAEKVRIAFKMPTIADDVKTQPAFKGKPEENQSGEKLYLAPAQAIALGKTLTVAVDYSPTLPGAADLPVPAPQRDWTLPIVFGVLVAAIAALTVIALRQQQRTAGTEAGEDEETLEPYGEDEPPFEPDSDSEDGTPDGPEDVPAPEASEETTGS